MTRVHLQIPALLLLATVLGAQAAPAAVPRSATQVPDAVVSPVAVVKHTRRTVTHKTVTRRTVRHHKSTAHAQSTNGTRTTK